MSPRQRQPTAERRRQIAQAALEILAEEGPRQLTSAAIARRVGIADGTIFRHFKDKDAIMEAAVGQIEAALFEDFPPDDPDPLDRLGRFFVGRLALMRERPEVVRVAMGDRLDGGAGPAAATRLRKVQERARAFVRDALVEAQDKGQVARDLSADVLAATILGTLRLAAGGELGTQRMARPEELWRTLHVLLSRTVD